MQTAPRAHSASCVFWFDPAPLPWSVCISFALSCSRNRHMCMLLCLMYLWFCVQAGVCWHPCWGRARRTMLCLIDTDCLALCGWYKATVVEAAHSLQPFQPSCMCYSPCAVPWLGRQQLGCWHIHAEGRCSQARAAPLMPCAAGVPKALSHDSTCDTCADAPCVLWCGVNGCVVFSAREG